MRRVGVRRVRPCNRLYDQRLHGWLELRLLVRLLDPLWGRLLGQLVGPVREDL